MRMKLANVAVRICAQERSDLSRFRLCAVVAAGSRIISHGINHFPNNGTARPLSIHAEVAAIRLIPHDTEATDIYVVRLLANGQLACSRPCINCMKAILEAHIDSVHFVNENGEWVTQEINYEE